MKSEKIELIQIPKRQKKPSMVTLRRAAQLPFELIENGDYSMRACLRKAARECKTNYKETLGYCLEHRDIYTEKTSRGEASMFFLLLAEKLKDDQKNVYVVNFEWIKKDLKCEPVSETVDFIPVTVLFIKSVKVHSIF